MYTRVLHSASCCSAVDDRGDTALHLASNHGNKDVVQFLAATGAALDIRDQAGYEPCHRAAMHGHVNCLMVLVAMGASINSQTDDNKTPLHLAAMRYVMTSCVSVVLANVTATMLWCCSCHACSRSFINIMRDFFCAILVPKVFLKV